MKRNHATWSSATSAAHQEDTLQAWPEMAFPPWMIVCTRLLHYTSCLKLLTRRLEQGQNCQGALHVIAFWAISMTWAFWTCSNQDRTQGD